MESVFLCDGVPTGDGDLCGGMGWCRGKEVVGCEPVIVDELLFALVGFVVGRKGGGCTLLR